ncbi:MAG: UDPglucose--hexose-phosphate uridylyltransferase [Acidimicrobiaceae bacterium]|nr:UDPglucose--hexose-phosphate uridylyltransferase [Acidimicrobiaceae bacterium]
MATHRQTRTFLPPESSCPLCPTRDAAHPTEVPWPEFDIAVFDNRFPSLTADPPSSQSRPGSPYDVAPSLGATEVIVYSDDHGAALTSLGLDRLQLLVDVWAERYAALGSRDDVEYVFVFENRGEAVGVTLDHPHGQVYAYPEVPPVPARELAVARAHLAEHGTCVLCDVVGAERFAEVRLVAQNDAFLAFVPFAARFPYEVHVVAKRHASSLLDLSDIERRALAAMLHEVVAGYDQLFEFRLPYVMSMHQAPTCDGDWQVISHFHIEFTPVHRSYDRLKYLAGSELGAGAFLNDVMPEQAAADLRAAGTAAAPSAGTPAAGTAAAPAAEPQPAGT